MKYWFKKFQILLPQKRVAKNIVISLMVIISFAVPLARVHAQDPDLPACATLSIDGGCIAQLTYYTLQVPSAWFLSMAGEIFDTMLVVSMDNKIIDASFANEGWKLTRDLANIAFIFILLYIALSRILQLGGPTTQSLLVRLIIVALLVNFSLFFTKVVIDSSNILAIGFYNQIQGSPVKTTYLSSDSNLVVKSISAPLVNAFSPQVLLGTNSFKKWGGGSAEGNVGLLVVFLVSAILNIVTAYSLLVVGILFLTRIGALWFLMIGAPIAFLAWILPNTGTYATRWWKFLLNQSFLAPIFLFFFFLIMKFVVDTDFLGNYFKESESLASFDGGSAMTGVIVSVLLKAAIVIMVINYAVKITKSLSTDAANGIVNKATGLARKAGGFAGGLAGGAALGLLKQQRAADAIRSQNALSSDGRFAKGLRKIPLYSQYRDSLAKGGREDVSEAKKKYESMGSVALKSTATNMATSKVDRRAITQILAARKDLKPNNEDFTSEFVETQVKDMKDLGFTKEELKEVSASEWQYVDTKKLTTKREGYGKDEIKEAVTKLVKSIKPDAIEDGLSAEIYLNEDIMQAMYKNFNSRHMEKLIDAGREKTTDGKNEISPIEEFVNGLEKLEQFVADGLTRADGINTDDVADELQKINKSLATWATTPIGKNVLERGGFNQAPKTS